MRWWVREPTIPLGSSRLFHFIRWPLRITTQEASSHMHVLGKTGSGKSYFLASLFLSLFEAGLPATLVDPHGDLAELVLSQLVSRGYYADPSMYERLIYLDIPAAATMKRY